MDEMEIAPGKRINVVMGVLFFAFLILAYHVAMVMSIVPRSNNIAHAPTREWTEALSTQELIEALKKGRAVNYSNPYRFP